MSQNGQTHGPIVANSVTKLESVRLEIEVSTTLLP